MCEGRLCMHGVLRFIPFNLICNMATGKKMFDLLTSQALKDYCLSSSSAS